MSLDFEWDNAKASDNYANHAVSVEAAERAFNDPFAIEWLDDRFDYGEDRYNLSVWSRDVCYLLPIPCETMLSALFPHEEPNPMKDADTTKTTLDRSKEPIDWTRFDAMTDEARHVAALSDPDAQPLSDDDLVRMRQIPRVKTLRRALGLTQEEFAARYHIPLGTLRDWEQSRTEPDQPARAYLTVIAHDPDGVQRALQNA